MKLQFKFLALVLLLSLHVTTRAQTPVIDVDEDRSDIMTAFAFNPDATLFATVTGNRRITLWDMATSKHVRTHDINNSLITALALSRDHVAAGGGSMGIKLWDAATGNLKHVLREHDGLVTHVAFSPDGRWLASASRDDTVRLWDVAGGRMLATIHKGKGGATAVAVSPDGKTIAAGGINNEITLWDAATRAELARFKAHDASVRVLSYSPDARFLASAGLDGTVKLWDASTWPSPTLLSSTKGKATSLAFNPDGSSLIWGAIDAKLKGTPLVFSEMNLPGAGDASRVAAGERPLCHIYSSADGDWAVIDGEGRFDASQGGELEWLRWKVGDELIALRQLKERHYEPRLLAKLLGLNREPFVVSGAMLSKRVGLFPRVSFDPPPDGSTRLKIELTSRGGGIGKVQVKVNNSEVFNEKPRPEDFDAPGQRATINVDLSDAPADPGKENEIRVIAWNEEGYLSSPGETRRWRPSGAADTSPPEFYAIVVGVSDYSDPSIRLKYAGRDADMMARVLSVGAKNLFNREGEANRVHVTLLTSDAAQPTSRTAADDGVRRDLPTKANIRRAFEELRRTRPQDLVIVYLSGHGIAVGGDIYGFLTKEAISKEPSAYSDPAVREQRAISSHEMAVWMKSVRALHRVMILDTCAASAAATALGGKGDISSYQIRAVDRLNDRTGFFILMGSAADAVSWEATRYAQSLLTYSLLQRMKVEAPAPESIEVAALFQHAADEVPRLALGIDGIQKPEIIVPQGGASFPIGLLTNEAKRGIRLQTLKPMLLRPVLLNRDEGTDDLELTDALRRQLQDENFVSAKGGAFQPEVVYVDAEKLQGAYRISGTYAVAGDAVTLDLVLTRDDVKLRVPVKGSKGALPDFVTLVVEKIYQALERAPK